MKEIIAALALAMQELKTKADAALKGMGPIDQYQGAQEVAYAIRTLNYSKEQVEEMLQTVNGVMEKYDAAIAAAVEPLAAAKLDEKIAAGELVRKTDHDLAIENAKTEGETAAAERLAAERKEEQAAAARRDEIAASHGKEVAAALPFEIFAADKFTDATKSEITRRVESLKEIGVAAAEKPAHFAEIVSCGSFDEEGKAAFDGRITQLKDLIGPKTPTAPAKKPAAPLIAASQFQQDDAETPEVAVF